MGAGGRAEGRGKWAPEITAKYINNKDGDGDDDDEDQDDNDNDDDRLYR